MVGWWAAAVFPHPIPTQIPNPLYHLSPKPRHFAGRLLAACCSFCSTSSPWPASYRARHRISVLPGPTPPPRTQLPAPWPSSTPPHTHSPSHSSIPLPPIYSSTGRDSSRSSEPSWVWYSGYHHLTAWVYNIQIQMISQSQFVPLSSVPQPVSEFPNLLQSDKLLVKMPTFAVLRQELRWNLKYLSDHQLFQSSKW